MLLKLPPVPDKYKSASQIARVVTEEWALTNLYCPKCGGGLSKYENNIPINDFECSQCNLYFQLKSQQKSFGARIVGASYLATANAIKENKTPSIALLQYDRNSWFVTNLLMIHGKCLTQDSIVERKGLSRYARRRGWIG